MRSLMKVFSAFAVLALVAGSLSSTASAQYTRTDLVADQAGAAPTKDPNLVNAWGLVALPFTPFWVSDNGTGFSTLYSGGGQQVPLFVTIPPAPGSAPGTLGTPTGVVGNISPGFTDFVISENGNSGGAFFIFATLDGTISGWNPGVDGISATGQSHATFAAGRSSVGAVYTGLAIGTNAGQNLLYAADNSANRRIDVFDAGFNLVPPSQLAPNAFEDASIPRNFTPYGIQNIKGDIWVTYTALNKAQGGFVDRFGPDGTLKQHFAVHGPLHSPWGLAQAPPDFGAMSNAILVSNNTSRGRINAFNASTGQFLGPLRDASGKAIEIDNVWALQFGGDGDANGTHKQLFFTAGPQQYGHGTFGVINVAH
jgi:uncharacterized protein (TIGR03118 family)